MTNTVMTFHESYGTLPKNILRLIRRFNVSPADYDTMLDTLNPWIDGDDSMPGRPDWDAVEAHIIDNSTNGYYTPRYF